ncbi:hypothetical protein RJ640_027771 [Escallonia rubra]|uniref:Uncharacterized protein n=1 Tax=Escallonia rubra TaxID=112253 RepID=A0AA88UBR2_9ASTE|nr:hypothetical protein RJ640_027771 [Escallonia rubra]
MMNNGKTEGGRICEEFSARYYGVCTIGGMLSAGTSHLAITPLDVLKVNMQVHPLKYKSISTCFSTILREQGPSAFRRGWTGKFFGYACIMFVYLLTSTLSNLCLAVSVVMFSTFEFSVDFVYSNVIKRRKEECSRPQQLGVTCLAGYAAGSVGSIISNPADNIVASLCNRKADSLIMAVKKIGIVKLFTRSLPIRILLVGPVVTLQWLFYDSIKVLSGL